MFRPTLSIYRAQFPEEAMGICRADPMVSAYCNEAQERLLMDPMAPDEGWFGGWVMLNLSVTVSNASAYVVTPREIARLIVTNVCQDPIRIRNGFYEYLKFGNGNMPKTCQSADCGSQFEAYERDNVVIFGAMTGTAQTIRIYPTDSRDQGLRVLVQGLDANNLVVLTTDPGTGQSAPGEYMQLSFPFKDSVNEFKTLTGIQKDQTYGPVQFFRVNPTTGVETALSTMEPNESSASYRRYLINGIPSTNLCCTTAGNPITVTAQGRLDFIPVINETDYLSIPNVPALIEESMSIRFGRMDSGNAAEQSLLHHGKALGLLNGQGAVRRAEWWAGWADSVSRHHHHLHHHRWGLRAGTGRA